MYKTGCPHSEGKILDKNYLQNEHLITPWVLDEIEEIANKASKILSEDSKAKDLISFFYQLDDLDLSRIMNAFIKYFQSSFDIQDDAYPEYHKYSNKRSKQDASISESLPQLLGIAFTDIFALLMLHVNYGYSLQRVKGLILKSMLSGNADIKQSPSGIIHSSLIHGYDMTNKTEITRRIKHGSTKNCKEHSYGEPSCPFLLSEEVEAWVDEVILFLLENFIPQLQDLYKHRTSAREKFYSGNMLK